MGYPTRQGSPSTWCGIMGMRCPRQYRVDHSFLGNSNREGVSDFYLAGFGQSVIVFIHGVAVFQISNKKGNFLVEVTPFLTWPGTATNTLVVYFYSVKQLKDNGPVVFEVTFIILTPVSSYVAWQSNTFMVFLNGLFLEVFWLQTNFLLAFVL